jgi:hypothetical protein
MRSTTKLSILGVESKFDADTMARILQNFTLCSLTYKYIRSEGEGVAEVSKKWEK